MESNKVEVVIDGIKYSLVADADGDKTQRIASFVDSKIKDTRESGSMLNQNMVYVLTMMNITGELFNKNDKYDNLVNESKEPIRRFQSISEEKEKLLEEKKGLEESVSKLKDDLVSSLNTISDINKKYSSLTEENKKNIDLADEKDIEIENLRDSIGKLQEESSQIQKLYQEAIKRIEAYQVK